MFPSMLLEPTPPWRGFKEDMRRSVDLGLTRGHMRVGDHLILVVLVLGGDELGRFSCGLVDVAVQASAIIWGRA